MYQDHNFKRLSLLSLESSLSHAIRDSRVREVRQGKATAFRIVLEATHSSPLVFYFSFKLHNIVLVLPNIEINPPQVYPCSPAWTLLPPPSPYSPSGSSQCTSPKHPVSCIEPGLATRFIHDIIHVSMPFSQISPPCPSPTESIRLIYTSVSLLLSRTQGYCYHLSKFHICALVYCIGVFLSGLLHSV